MAAIDRLVGCLNGESKSYGMVEERCKSKEGVVCVASRRSWPVTTSPNSQTNGVRTVNFDFEL